MNKEKRRNNILEILNKEGSVEVSKLADYYKISEMSIRNDLNYLSNLGKLQRTYGGALVWSRSNLELSLREKQERNLREKSMIGVEAAKYIHDGDTIMLDSGTTTQCVAKLLTNHNNLTIITNGINIINTLAGIDEITLYTVGGQINARSYAIVGSEAERELENYRAGFSIISVDGVDLVNGLTNNSRQDVNITKIFIKNANKKILVADSGKIGKTALMPICKLDDIDILITDDKTPDSFLSEIRKLDIEIIIARE